MWWSLLLETYRKNLSFSDHVIHFSPQVWLPVPPHRSAQLKLTVQQTSAVVIFSRYSVLSLCLSSFNAIPNLVSWHHLDQLHIYALSHTWQSDNLYPRTLYEMWWKPHELQRINSASKEFSSEIPRLRDFLTSEGVDYLKRRMVHEEKSTKPCWNCLLQQSTFWAI